MKKIENGDRYGRLTVIRETTKEERKNPAGRNYWCKCDCGKEIIVYGHNLKTGNTKSCGCLSRDTASKGNSIDMPLGSTYGDLTIIARAPKVEGKNLVYWTCQCTCGNIIDVPGARLRDGSITSCGCKKFPNRIDEIGKQYGLLTVISYAGSRTNGGALWECKCQCGRSIIARGDSLRNGSTTSCGCISSYPEEKIADLLDNYHIDYKRQYSFDDLCSEKGNRLRFDFAIFKQHILYCLIEYQGQQHTDINNSWYTEEAHQRDLLKKQYCQKHNLLLYEWDKNTNLEQAILKLSEETE